MRARESAKFDAAAIVGDLHFDIAAGRQRDFEILGEIDIGELQLGLFRRLASLRAR